MTQRALIETFDRQAKKYDRNRSNGRIDRYRRRIFTQAEGKVLEVAVGAGANFPFYRDDVELTGIDFSPEMLKAARAAVDDHRFSATFIEGDVETAVFEDNSFDTIVSSLSFCAYQDPRTVLDQFQKWCRPEGNILMMEHGLSASRIVAKVQQLIDPISLKFIGCHQNRDIINIVRQSDLELAKQEQHLMGCLYLLWVKPR